MKIEAPRECPFCDAEPSRLKLVVKHNARDAHSYGYVRCLRCNARGPLVRGELYDTVFCAAWDGWNNMREKEGADR